MVTTESSQRCLSYVAVINVRISFGKTSVAQLQLTLAVHMQFY